MGEGRNLQVVIADRFYDCPCMLPDPGVSIMWDIGCVVASIAFFIIAIAYTAGCERLVTKAGK